MIKRYLFLVSIVGAIPAMPMMGTLLPPPVPTLIFPGDSSWITDNTPTFIWSTVDVSVTYTLQYTADSSFGSGVMEISGLSDTFYTTPAPLADTTFYWRVEAINFSAEGSGYQAYPFRFSIDSKKPSVPQLSHPNGYTNDLTPKFIWGGVTKKKGSSISYRLQCALDGGFANIVIDTSNLSGTNFTPVDALSDTTHYFRVEACDLAGNCSGVQGHLSFTIDTTKPGTPSLILPGDSSQINDNTPTLIWSSSTEPTVIYTVIAAIDSDFIYTILRVDRSDTFYTVISPIADTIIFWKVRARDYAGNYSSFQSHPFRFEIDARVPATPVLLFPEDSSLTRVSMPTFKWSAVSKFPAPVRYIFQCALDSEFTSLVIDTSNLSETSFTPAIPLSDETYFFRVKACDLAENCSDYQTHPFIFTIDTKPPSIPVLISPPDSSVLDFSIPTFIWGKAIDAVSSVKYTLQCSVDSTFTQPGLSVKNLTDTSYTVYGGLENGVYYWRVDAVDELNNHSGYQARPFQFNIATEMLLSIRAIMQGYYNPSSHITPVAGVRVELRDCLNPQNMVHLFPNMLLDSTGRKLKYKCEDLAAGHYYAVVKKINHLAVITDSPCHFEVGKLADIDFTSAGVAQGIDPMWFESDGLYSLRGGDLDQDGVVFISDYCKLAQNWSTNDSIGDINNDGVVFISDYSILAQNWARVDYLPEHQPSNPNPQTLTPNSQLSLATFYIRTWPDSSQSGYYADSTVTLEIVVSLADAEFPFVSYAVGNFLAYDTTLLSLIDYEDNISYEELYESFSDMTDDGKIQYSRMKKIGTGNDTGWVIQNPNAVVPYKLIFKVQHSADSCLTHLIFTNASLSDSNFNSINTQSQNFPLTILGQGIEEKPVPRPPAFEGLNVYPNPTYGGINIKFAVPTQIYASLKVYDISGTLVRTLMDNPTPAGYYTLSWNTQDNFGSPAPSGVYFLRFETKKFKSVKKALILK